MILLAGSAAAMTGLARLATAGFAPDGNVLALVLAALGCGVIGTLFSGRPPPADLTGRGPAGHGLDDGPATPVAPRHAQTPITG
jgi:hypothetical protein